jgi:septal ring factor EnvC (AmiA/AmiB activator)
MNTKYVTITLLVIAVLSVAFSVFQYTRSADLAKETNEWRTKYEEALIDMEDANKRIEAMRVDLEKALKESELHRARAEAALIELQQHKLKKR